jgi:hypothetical protein
MSQQIPSWLLGNSNVGLGQHTNARMTPQTPGAYAPMANIRHIPTGNVRAAPTPIPQEQDNSMMNLIDPAGGILKQLMGGGGQQSIGAPGVMSMSSDNDYSSFLSRLAAVDSSPSVSAPNLANTPLANSQLFQGWGFGMNGVY